VSESVEPERVRPGGRPGRRARAAGERAGPAAPTNPDLPVHRAAAEKASSYVWEDFRRGNFLSVRNGASSQRIFGPLARQLADGLVKACPDLGDVRYAAAVTRWSECEAQESLLMFELDQVVSSEGITSERAEQIQKSLDKVRGRGSKLRSDLGLTPRGHVELVAGRAQAEYQLVDLDATRRRGRAALEARARADEDGAV
jgi:hypothetical protein